LARWPADHEIYLALERLQLLPVSLYETPDLMWLGRQPLWPVEPPTLFREDEVVLEGLECKRTFLDGEQPLPSGIHQAEREAAAPCE
jgi:hypothetical protein